METKSKCIILFLFKYCCITKMSPRFTISTISSHGIFELRSVIVSRDLKRTTIVICGVVFQYWLGSISPLETSRVLRTSIPTPTPLESESLSGLKNKNIGFGVGFSNSHSPPNASRDYFSLFHYKETERRLSRIPGSGS